MALSSTIEWTESTWNPVTGCTKVSPACQNCYAERMAKRLKAMGNSNYSNGFKVTVHSHVLEYPLNWAKPQTIFVNSMSDLFHEEISDNFIMQVFEVMNRAYWHKFQILTKRVKRLKELNGKLQWGSNIWMGVSIENQDYTYRIDYLRETNANIKFLSIEPLLGPINNLNLDGIDWVIVGGESGPKSRPMDLSWVVNIKEKCINSKTPFFFKQWGGFNKKKRGRILEGQTWDEMPTLV